MCAPVMALIKGFSLTASNTPGSVTSGDVIKFAPGFIEKELNIKSDVSTELTSNIEVAEAFTLPEALSGADTDVKGTIGAMPSSTAKGT
jgi:hypothetical protein